ncbi:MAG: prolyl oligopeptidase family serine peptidase [Anaerolineales bacterium]|nr:prolyl oligopeptidase family serine peptidase [Anaerolineales bacterium]
MKPEEILDALLNLPILYYPKVSRDGSKAAWTWSQVGPTAEVFYVPTDGSSSPIQLTQTDQDTWIESWSPDSKSVIVAQDRDGDERYQLFRIDIDQPLVMEPLTESKPNYFLRGGQLHPNERWLVYAINFDVTKGVQIEATWIYRHDLSSGERIPLAKPEEPAYVSPKLNQQGTCILYNRKDLHPAGKQVWLVDIDGHEDREILNFGAQVKTYASWFPDGERILVLAEKESYRRLGIWNRNDESLEWLIDNPSRNLESAFVPPNGEEVVVVEVRDARIRSSLLSPDTGEEWFLPEMPLNLIPLAPVDNDEWVVRAYSSTQPDDLLRLNLHEVSEAPLSLTRLWDCTDLRPDDLVAAEDFRWRSIDGLQIQGWLYRTTHQPKGTVVTVHGGPTWHSQDKIDTQIQFLLSQGFNVLDPNYRGSTGFGLEFQESIKVDGWGGKEQDDIVAGVQALTNEGIAKSGNIGITGTSYGGYSAWCAITRNPPELIAASAPICGMTDLVVDYETTRPDLRPYSAEMMSGTPQEAPERYFERSPINFVENIQGDLLIVQGMKDPNVTPENVREVRGELEKANIPYDLFPFEDEGHGIFRPKNLKRLYMRLASFFEESFSSSSDSF